MAKVQKTCNINSNIFSFLLEHLCMISFLPLLRHSLCQSVVVKQQVQQLANDMRLYGSRTAELHFFYQLPQNTELSLPFPTVKMNTVSSPGSMSLQEIASLRFAYQYQWCSEVLKKVCNYNHRGILLGF